MKKISKKIAGFILLAALCSFMSISVFAADENVQVPDKVVGLTQTKATATSFAIEWSTPSYCKNGYYSIQTSVDNINWTTLGFCQGCNKIVSSLSSGQTMYVRVAAYADRLSNEILGEYSDPLEVATAPAKVTNVTQTAAALNSVTISWDAVPGATYYNIHANDDVKTVIATTDTNSFVVGGLSSNTQNYYLVSAVKKSTAGFAASDKNDTVRVSTKTLPGKMSKDSFGISNFWTYLGQVNFARSTPSNANGTQLEVRTVKGNKSVWTTDDSSYYKFVTAKALKYRCRAYIEIGGAKVYGPWSEYRYFAHQKVQAQSQNGKKIQLTWKKISGATSYTVYISKASESGYKKVKAVSSKKNSYVITKMGKKKLKKNTTYYVRVVPQIKSGKKIFKSEVYSQASITLK